MVKELLSLISSPVKVIFGCCGWNLDLNSKSFPGNKGGEIVLKSKAGVVWVLESWAELSLTSAPWKTRVLDYLICAEALAALPAFPLLQRLPVNAIFAAESWGWPFWGVLQSRTWAGAAQRLNHGLLCWQQLKALGVGESSENVWLHQNPLCCFPLGHCGHRG